MMNTSSNCSLLADFQYHLFSIIYSLVFILGLIENVLALYVLTCKVKNSTQSYVYFINLAVVDTMFVCMLPFRIHYHINENNWIFGDITCRITGTLYFTNIYLSIGFFTCICVDRYIAVVHPLTYLRIRVSHYNIVLTVLLWAIAVAIVVPLVLGGRLDNFLENNKTACYESFPESSWKKRLVPYNTCALVFGFVIPFSIIMISYPLIAKRISKIQTSIHKKKALRTIFMILAISILCFLPYHLTHLLHFMMRARIFDHCAFNGFIYKLRRITLALVSFNCCLNPIMYYFTTSTYSGRLRLRLRGLRAKKVYTIYDRDMNTFLGTYRNKP
ncbi:lysophosphatidic acid receptor 6-like [Rhinatrema bivittatum]|uniref:lysophosphatidic acid receptor 6-like n=1 Tax=Rhinatrema bivittatum TaxID=194408 RepID=UPI00112C4A06|nr:lysophosphatidic acid receptor 6-like [Rhinatrema bivittatum]